MENRKPAVEILIVPVPFEIIEPVWRQELWPSREDVRPTSSMTLDGRYDLALHGNPRWFFCARDRGGELLGVNSLLLTGPSEGRSRGLFVRPAHRKRGVANALLLHCLDWARRQGCETVWTYARESAWNVYQSAGFVERGGAALDGHRYAVAKPHARSEGA